MRANGDGAARTRRLKEKRVDEAECLRTVLPATGALWMADERRRVFSSVALSTEYAAAAAVPKQHEQGGRRVNDNSVYKNM